MMRKLIVDSVCWWASEYRIKGFRFDLMGCLDTDTMRAVKDALYAIDPSIVVYGEGWAGSGDGSTGLSSGYTEAKTNGTYAKLAENGKGSVGCFNDGGRDGTKGNTNGQRDPFLWLCSQGSGDLRKIPNIGPAICGGAKMATLMTTFRPIRPLTMCLATITTPL